MVFALQMVAASMRAVKLGVGRPIIFEKVLVILRYIIVINHIIKLL